MSIRLSQPRAISKINCLPVGSAVVKGSLPRSVSGLLFDVGDVLHDATVWRRWLLRLLGQLGLCTNYRSFFCVWDRDFLHDVYRGRREFCEAFEAFLLSLGLSRAQIDEVEAACEARRGQWEFSARLLPGVKSTLKQLHANGLVLGVLSNSEHPAGVLGERLKRLGLGGLFQAVISSIDLERIMPEAVCYRTALAALKLPADRVAFVGHDKKELAGARDVGMPAIAFNFDPDAEADVYVARFEGLLEAVGAAVSRDMLPVPVAAGSSHGP